MAPKKNRTLICSVVFTDIVGYSTLPVARQQEVKAAFNEIVSAELTRVPEEERIVLDTGDGAALCFLGDPEDALYVAMALRNAFAERREPTAEAQASEGAFPAVRIGINLGPVKTVEDINGRVNLLGDGINVGERVMSFCDADQILVSRSYYEVIARLSSRHESLFRFYGERRDKHVREHVLYEVHLQEGWVEDPRIVGSEVVQLRGEGLAPGETPSDHAAPAYQPDEALARRAVELLAPRLGPMADVIVERAIRRARNETELVDALAASLGDEAAERAFRTALQEGRHAAADAKGDAGAPASTAGRPWTDADLQRLEALLTPRIGPLASVLVSRAAKRDASYAGLCEDLASELRDDGARAAFLDATAERGGSSR